MTCGCGVLISISIVERRLFLKRTTVPLLNFVPKQCRLTAAAGPWPKAMRSVCNVTAHMQPPQVTHRSVPASIELSEEIFGGHDAAQRRDDEQSSAGGYMVGISLVCRLGSRKAG